MEEGVGRDERVSARVTGEAGKTVVMPSALEEAELKVAEVKMLRLCSKVMVMDRISNECFKGTCEMFWR